MLTASKTTVLNSAILTACASVALWAATTAPAAEGDWPTHRGPTANGAGVDTGREMVEDLAQARMIWMSEEKTPSAYPINYRGGNGYIQGGYAAPVVAGGKVFLFYWVPGGDVTDEAYVAKAKAEPRIAVLGDEVIRRKFAISADDVVLAVDAATGKTAWKNEHKGKGLSYSKQGRGVGISVKGTPRLDVCVAGGKVFAIGTTGRIYCMDAASGSDLWESKLPAANEAAEKAKQAALKGAEAGGRSVSLTVCPLVVAGVLVVDDQGGLYGLEPATGKPLWGPVGGWRNAGGSCPLKWVHKGRELIVAESTCIDPKTGKVLWKAEGAVHSDESGCVAVTEDYLVCCGGGRKGGTGMQCYRITPEGATKAWALGPQYAAKQFCSPVIYKGHVYTRAGGDNSGTKMICVELAAGKVVASAECGGSCNEVVAVDGRLFYESSYAGPQMYKTDAKDFRLLSSGVLKGLDFACSVPPAIAGGRLYYRSNSNGIMCLDLSKGCKEGKPVDAVEPPKPAAQPKGAAPAGTPRPAAGASKPGPKLPAPGKLDEIDDGI